MVPVHKGALYQICFILSIPEAHSNGFSSKYPFRATCKTKIPTKVKVFVSTLYRGDLHMTDRI